MKKLLILLLIVSLNAEAQKDTSLFKVDTSSAFLSIVGGFIETIIRDYTNDSNYAELTYSHSDSTITIKGDTMKIIRLMLKYLNEKDSLISEHWKLIGSSVLWANQVPDSYKTKQNKWNEYVAMLKKHGYTITKHK